MYLGREEKRRGSLALYIISNGSFFDDKHWASAASLVDKGHLGLDKLGTLYEFYLHSKRPNDPLYS